MKSLLLSFFVLIGSMTFAPKKAEAGIILATAASGPVGVALIIGGSGSGFVGLLYLTEGSDVGGMSAGFLLSGAGALLLLDAQEALDAKDQFKTIPEYIFDEIEAIADNREAEAVLIKENIKEIILTDEEVDELFITLDESADQEELNKLRLMLTTSTHLN